MHPYPLHPTPSPDFTLNLPPPHPLPNSNALPPLTTLLLSHPFITPYYPSQSLPSLPIPILCQHPIHPHNMAFHPFPLLFSSHAIPTKSLTPSTLPLPPITPNPSSLCPHLWAPTLPPTYYHSPYPTLAYPLFTPIL